MKNVFEFNKKIIKIIENLNKILVIKFSKKKKQTNLIIK